MSRGMSWTLFQMIIHLKENKTSCEWVFRFEERKKNYVAISLAGVAKGSSKVTSHEFLEHLSSMTFSSNLRAENIENSGCRTKLNK